MSRIQRITLLKLSIATELQVLSLLLSSAACTSLQVSHNSRARTPVWPCLPAAFGHDAPLARGTPLRCDLPPAARKSEPGGRPTSRPSPAGDSPRRPLPPPLPASGLLPASPSRHPGRAGETGTSSPPRPLPLRKGARAAQARAGTYRDTVQTRSWQPPPQRLPGSGRSGAELRCPTRARGGARSFPPPPAPPAGAMGWEEKQVRGYSEFVETAQRYHGRPIFALFCGDKDAEGRSWCPDCVTGEAREACRGGRDARLPAGGASAGAGADVAGGAPRGREAPALLRPSQGPRQRRNDSGGGGALGAQPCGERANCPRPAARRGVSARGYALSLSRLPEKAGEAPGALPGTRKVGH